MAASASASSSYFDDDEETLPIGFEQDPESDDIGEGTWKYADGTTKYSAGDPSLAKQLMAQPAAPAEGPKGSAPPSAGQEGTGEFAGTRMGPDGNVYDSSGKLLAGPPSADDEFLDSTTGAEAEDAQPQPEASEKPKPIQPLTAPQMPGARGPARFTDSTSMSDQQSASESNQNSVSHTGSAQDRGEFEQGQRDIARSYDAQGQAIDEGAQGVVAAQRQHQQSLMQMAADKEAVTAGAQASSEARKQAVIKKYQEVDSRPTDINKLWKDKGALGTTLGMLGIALRSITATKFGGPNTALQSIQEQKRQNIQAQVDDRNSELRGLERELGSIEAAAPMLEARMNDALSKRLDAMLLDEKSATTLANGKQLKAQLETEKAAKIAESAKAYAGTLAQQQTQASQLGRTQGVNQERQRLSGAGVGGEGGGQKRMTPREIAEADQAWEEQGVPPEERAKLWQQNGYAAPNGKTAAEYKREKEEAEKADPKRSEAEGKAQASSEALSFFYKKAGLTRDSQTGKWKPSDEGVVPPGFVESINPFDDNDIEAAGEAATEAYGRMQSGGVIGKDERPAFRDMVGLNTSNRAQLAARANAIESTLNARTPGGERQKDAARAPKGRPIPTPGTRP